MPRFCARCERSVHGETWGRMRIASLFAAITLLTRRRWLQAAVYGVAGGGVAVGVLALLHV